MPTNLQPQSLVSAVVLPATGTHSDVSSALAYSIYSTDSFISGAVDQVAYVYNKLGGNVLDLEITPNNVYNAYEEACLEYSYLLNTHQAKNVLSDMLGNNTGSFDEDGELTAYTHGTGSNPQLRFPRFQLGYATHIGRGAGLHVRGGVGSTQRIYSASFTPEDNVQQYDLQDIIYSASLDEDSLFYNKVGKNMITIQRVYYETPKANWRFFGGTPIGTVGNLSTYGMYADDSTFEVVPVWQNILQAGNYNEAMEVRASHYSFELNDNFLKLFPVPDGFNPKKFWVDFRAAEDAFEEQEFKQYGSKGVNNINTLPFPNVPYKNINSIGKQWIRRYALALCKETLGQVRSKLGTIPIPGNDVTLNGSDLISQAKEEQSMLRDELKAVFDELVYGKLAEGDSIMQENIKKVLSSIPDGIYVG